MAVRWFWVGLVLPALWLQSATARGDDPAGADSAEFVAPDGIPGALLLCGPGCSSDAVLSLLERRSRLGQVVIASVGGVGGLAVEINRLDSLKSDGVCAVHATRLADLSRVAPGLWSRDCDLLWLHLDAGAVRELTTASELTVFLRRTQERGGTIVASGAAAAALIGVSGGDADTPFTLLPGCDWCAVAADPSVRPPEGGRVGLRIDDAAILSVRGRQLTTPRSSTGHVTLTLAGSDVRPERTIVMPPGSVQDLTALRRAAVARAGGAWPPAVCEAPRVEQGTLFIVGGGTLTDPIVERFVELAGGSDARILVVPTAAEPEGVQNRPEIRQFLDAGAGRVELLHAKDREAAGSDEFLRPLRETTAVWFTGGRHWRLVDRYEETPFVAACRELLARGGVIGGSSAGATIQGDYLVRGSPLGNEEMMAEGYERGFGFLPGTAIDQHFAQRKRGSDMVALKRAFPQLLGIGIDESTALLVTGHRAEVLGRGAVSFYDRPEGGAAEEPTIVSSGGVYDFERRASLPAP